MNFTASMICKLTWPQSSLASHNYTLTTWGCRKDFRGDPAVIGAHEVRSRSAHTIYIMESPKKWSGQNWTSRTGSCAYTWVSFKVWNLYLIFRVLTERFSNHCRPRKIGEGAEMNERELNLRTDSGRKEREVEKTEGERACLLMCCSNIPSCSHMQDTRSSNYKLPLSTTTAIANKTWHATRFLRLINLTRGEWVYS